MIGFSTKFVGGVSDDLNAASSGPPSHLEFGEVSFRPLFPLEAVIEFADDAFRQKLLRRNKTIQQPVGFFSSISILSTSFLCFSPNICYLDLFCVRFNRNSWVG